MGKKEISSHGIATDISPTNNVLGVENSNNVIEHPDKEDELTKKVESRLSFFNAVSKSNCCDCYKEGYGSKNIKEVSWILVLSKNFFGNIFNILLWSKHNIAVVRKINFDKWISVFQDLKFKHKVILLLCFIYTRHFNC